MSCRIKKEKLPSHEASRIRERMTQANHEPRLEIRTGDSLAPLEKGFQLRIVRTKPSELCRTLSFSLQFLKPLDLGPLYSSAIIENPKELLFTGVIFIDI